MNFDDLVKQKDSYNTNPKTGRNGKNYIGKKKNHIRSESTNAHISNTSIKNLKFPRLHRGRSRIADISEAPSAKRSYVQDQQIDNLSILDHGSLSPNSNRMNTIDMLQNTSINSYQNHLENTTFDTQGYSPHQDSGSIRKSLNKQSLFSLLLSQSCDKKHMQSHQ